MPDRAILSLLERVKAATKPDRELDHLVHDALVEPIGQRLYNKKSGVVQGDQGGAPQQFENGKVYTDANGNRAKYVDGKWQGVK